MNLRNKTLILLVSTGCVLAEPIGDQPATETSAGDDGAGSDDGGHTGQTSLPSDDGDRMSTTVTETDADTDAFGSDGNGTGTATSPTGGDTDSSDLLEQCGIELPPTQCVDVYTVECSCNGCELQWDNLDEATASVIISACDCLCEAAGCGFSNSSDVGGGDEGCDSGTTGGDEFSTVTDPTDATEATSAGSSTSTSSTSTGL